MKFMDSNQPLKTFKLSVGFCNWLRAQGLLKATSNPSIERTRSCQTLGGIMTKSDAELLLEF